MNTCTSIENRGSCIKGGLVHNKRIKRLRKEFLYRSFSLIVNHVLLTQEMWLPPADGVYDNLNFS